MIESVAKKTVEYVGTDAVVLIDGRVVAPGETVEVPAAWVLPEALFVEKAKSKTRERR